MQCSRRAGLLYRSGNDRRFAAQILPDKDVVAARQGPAWLHLIASEVVFAEVLEVLAELVGRHLVGGSASQLAVLQDFVFHVDRAIHTQGEGQGVGRTRIDTD